MSWTTNRFDLVDRSHTYKVDLSSKLDSSFKYIIQLRIPSKILIDDRALRAINCIYENEPNKSYESILKKNSTIIEIFANILEVYMNDFKAFVTNYDVYSAKRKTEGVERIYNSQFSFFSEMMGVIWNLSAISAFFRTKFYENRGLIALLNYLQDSELVRNCQRLRHTFARTEESQPGLQVLLAMIDSINNLSKISDSMPKDLLHDNATSILVNFSEEMKELNVHQMLAYMAITNVIRDKDIEKLPQTKFILQALCNLIKTGAKAIQKKNVQRHKFDIKGKTEEVFNVKFYDVGFNLVELIESLYKISINDSIKYEIYENLKEALLPILNEGVAVEKEYTAKLLWQLCFNERVIQKVNEDKEIVSLITKENSSKILKSYCSGILWYLKQYNQKNQTSKDNENKELSTDLKNTSNANNQNEKIHLFISYNRESQELCNRIKKALEDAGQKVWTDRDGIHGSSIDTVAKAIEQSKYVLICMTEKYKKSPYCRFEAEYALKNKVSILPLILKKDYEPDGWLIPIANPKPFFDFTKSQFDECIKQLLAVISPTVNAVNTKQNNEEKEKVLKKSDDKVKKEVEKKLAPIKEEQEILFDDPSGWNKEQTAKWLRKSIHNHDMLKLLRDFDGPMLKQLHKIKKELPEYFYTSFRDTYKLDLIQMVKLTTELDQLFI